MSDLYNKIVSDRGTLENLASKIPGFSGYMEMSARREADRQIRDHVAKQYEALLTRFGQIERDMISGGDISLMDKTKSTRTKIETLRRRIASDTPGYTGFFSANKIGPDELAKVYAFDEAMTRYVDELSAKLDSLAAAVASQEEVQAALAAVDSTALEASMAYDLRDEVLNDIA